MNTNKKRLSPDTRTAINISLVVTLVYGVAFGMLQAWDYLPRWASIGLWALALVAVGNALVRLLIDLLRQAKTGQGGAD